jgi:transposase-like protein
VAKRTYSDEQRAAVLLALEVNQGNIARTARNTGVPEATVRDWRDTWEREGVPPELMAVTEQIATDFVEAAEEIRDLAMADLKRQILAMEVKPAQLIATIGVLEDKIRLGKGLATSRSETVHTVDPAAIRAELESYVLSALEAEAEREQDIIDAEWEEQSPQGELLRAV